MKLKCGKTWFLGEERFEVLDYTPKAKPVCNLQEISDNYKYRILQLDGGGILGVMPVYHLHNLEMHYGPVINHFHAIWGCSTGAIIAAMLNIGWSAKKLMKWYVEKGPIVFHEKPFWGGLIWGSLYNPEFLEKTLKEALGNITFLELYKRTGIELNLMVVNVTDERPEVWNYQNTPKFEVWAGVRASMSAPVYFPIFKYKGKEYYDGGTGGFGSTAEKAYNKAYYVHKKKIEDFYLISLGCGRGKVGKVNGPLGKFNIAKWVFSYARMEAAQRQEKFLEYRAQDSGLNYYRWNIDLPKSLDHMDKTDNINELIELIDK